MVADFRRNEDIQTSKKLFVWSGVFFALCWLNEESKLSFETLELRLFRNSQKVNAFSPFVAYNSRKVIKARLTHPKLTISCWFGYLLYFRK